MEYYIDFDNTIYDTSALKHNMLEKMANEISKYVGKSQCELFSELINNSNKGHIYKLAEYFGEKYNINVEKITESVKNVISDGRKFVYEDSEEFLGGLKSKGYKVNLFSYSAKENIEYQLEKIDGSGLKKYFDNILIITSEKKDNLNIDYNDGIFIDDNPKALEGISTRKPLKLIRVKRKNNKYSSIEIKIDGLIEVENLKELEEMTT